MDSVTKAKKQATAMVWQKFFVSEAGTFSEHEKQTMDTRALSLSCASFADESIKHFYKRFGDVIDSNLR